MGVFKLFKGMADAVTDQIKEVTDEVADRVQDIRDDISDQFKPFGASVPKVNSVKGRSNSGTSDTVEIADVYGVEYIVVKRCGDRFALFHKKEKKLVQVSQFEYDTAMGMSPYHVAVGKRQPDGSIMYAVATGRGWSEFKLTSCEYKEVRFFDGKNILVIDEDDEEFIIDREGDTVLKEKYVDDFIHEHESVVVSSESDENDDDSDEYED